MRRKLIILIILLSSGLLVSAQSETVTLRNGRAVNDTLFNSRIFFLKDFVNSRITMKDGSVYNAKANIVTIDHAVAMIEDSGDTIRVSKEKDIVSFSGGGALIYKIDGLYYQIIETNGDVSLAILKRLGFEKEKLQGAYGASNETSSISRVTRTLYDILGGPDDIDVEMWYTYQELLFLVSKNRTYSPTKRNFERLFGKRKADIAEFLGDNEQQLSKDENIIRLFKHLIE